MMNRLLVFIVLIYYFAFSAYSQYDKIKILIDESSLKKWGIISFNLKICNSTKNNFSIYFNKHTLGFIPISISSDSLLKDTTIKFYHWIYFCTLEDSNGHIIKPKPIDALDLWEKRKIGVDQPDYIIKKSLKWAKRHKLQVKDTITNYLRYARNKEKTILKRKKCYRKKDIFLSFNNYKIAELLPDPLNPTVIYIPDGVYYFQIGIYISPQYMKYLKEDLELPLDKNTFEGMILSQKIKIYVKNYEFSLNP